MNRFLGTIVSWLRAGYPNGVPSNDYLPILALLSRRLSCDEVTEVAKLMDRLPHPGFVDIGVEILASPTNYRHPPTSSGFAPCSRPTAGPWMIPVMTRMIPAMTR